MSLQMLLVASKCSSSKTFACCDFVSGVKACGQANLWLNVSSWFCAGFQETRRAAWLVQSWIK